MSWLLVLPIVVPLTTALMAFAVRGYPRLERALSILGAAALLTVAVILLRRVLSGGILAAQMGGWPAPFGITLVADHRGIHGPGSGWVVLADPEGNEFCVQ